VNLRLVIIVSLTLIFLLLAGAGWLLFGQSAEGELTSSRDVAPASIPPSTAPMSPLPEEATADSRSVLSQDEPPQSVAQVLEGLRTTFVAQADPDPILSRELERALERTLALTTDRSRFDIESIACRGYTCQVLSIDRIPPFPHVRGPPDLRQGWGAVLDKTMHQLKDSGIQNPHTGAPIGNVRLEELVMGEGMGQGFSSALMGFSP
jgi:hypothetical protein